MRSGDSSPRSPAARRRVVAQRRSQFAALGAKGRGAAGRCLEREGRRGAQPAGASAAMREAAKRRRMRTSMRPTEGAALCWRNRPPRRRGDTARHATPRPRPAAGRAGLAPGLPPRRVRSPPCRAGGWPRRRRRPHPDYPGADRRTGAPSSPWLVYRGPIVSIDERGIRSRFVDTPNWSSTSPPPPPSTRAATRGATARARLPVRRRTAAGTRAGRRRRRRRSAHFKLPRDPVTPATASLRAAAPPSAELRWRRFGVTGAGSVLTASLPSRPGRAGRCSATSTGGCGRGHGHAPAYRRAPAWARRSASRCASASARELSWFAAAEAQRTCRARPIAPARCSRRAANLSVGAGLGVDALARQRSGGVELNQ